MCVTDYPGAAHMLPHAETVAVSVSAASP